jgi:hypothetical protein
MTPPMASEPYWAECAPLAISMRWTELNGMLKTEVSPLVAAPMRTPLTNIRVCAALVPRSATPARAPIPPLAAMDIPG